MGSGDWGLGIGDWGLGAGYSYEQFWGMLEDEDRNKLADVFKETFGDDVFVNFGKYYQAHKSDSY